MGKPPRIAIVGGGPGGLTLARILHVRGVSATVFEREDSPAGRSQGGSLDIHEEDGQVALRLAGLEAEFRSIARYEDQGMRLFDRDGVLHFEESAEDGDQTRPEVDRAHLRGILLDSLPPGVVRWGRRVTSIQPRDDGTYEIVFATGEVEAFDLIVGADGGRSRVRPLVSNAEPSYTGVTLVSLGFDDADARHPEVAGLVGRGMMFALGDERGLLAHRDANAHVGVYVGLKVPEGWAASGVIDPDRLDEAKALLDEQFAGWSPKLRRLIHDADDLSAVLPLHALPVGHGWEHRPGVTLLGDAAHLMSPFGGDGVNLAMTDAADLAQALTDFDDWRAALPSYESAMCDRAEPAAAGAAEGVSSTFAPDALETTLHHMRIRRETVH